MKTISLITLLVLFSCGRLQPTYEDSYHDNGSIKSKSEVKNGVRNGMHYEYYKSGVKSKQVAYNDGKRGGTRIVYYESGEIMEEIDFLNDKKEGQYFTYYKNGDLKKQGHFKNDIQNGLLKEYDRQGILRLELRSTEIFGGSYGIYKKTYDQSGNLVSFEEAVAVNLMSSDILKIDIDNLDEYDSAIAILGKFNYYFEPINRNQLDTINLKSSDPIRIELTKYLDQDLVRGQVWLLKEKMDGDTTIIDKYLDVFEKSFSNP